MKKAVLFLIRSYQLSRPFRPAACRFYPSCSSYAHDCIKKHGIATGGILTIWRLLRCQPFCAGGIDEVPEAVNFNFNMIRSFVSKRV